MGVRGTAASQSGCVSLALAHAEPREAGINVVCPSVPFITIDWRGAMRLASRRGGGLVTPVLLDLIQDEYRAAAEENQQGKKKEKEKTVSYKGKRMTSIGRT